MTLSLIPKLVLLHFDQRGLRGDIFIPNSGFAARIANRCLNNLSTTWTRYPDTNTSLSVVVAKVGDFENG